MNLYRKKPVVVEAVQWDGTAEGATRIIDWILEGSGTARYHEPLSFRARGSDFTGAYIAIDTLEGTMWAQSGDWIIRGVKGEHYPCKPDVFKATYEAAE